ncbi:hypothetical protein NR798_25385 [Archangium gephyra]|uniref:hypothetical protein n=1 Tax=Archangium gephyra TaxID=48 RepID=UPI0035D4CFC9
MLAVAVVLAGCKSNPPAATPDAGVAAAPAQAPTALPAPGPALSYLKSVGSQRCEWIRQPLPSGAPTTIFAFDGDCSRSEVTWSPNGKEGLVFTWPVGEGAVPRVWRVDLTAKTGKPMELKGLPGGTGEQGPDKPYIEKVGFDAQGRPVVLVSDVYSDREPEKGPGGEQLLSFEGQRYPLTGKLGEGRPGLALAYRLEGADWKRFETKASVYEAENAPGVNVLDAARALSVVQSPTAARELPGQQASESAARMLDAAFPGQDESGKWMTLTTPGGALHYRASNPGDDSLRPAVPVRWEQDGKLAELEGLTAKEGDRLGFQLRGGLLVVTVQGETSHASVYDTRTKKNLVSVQGAESAALWPEPSKP